MNIEDALYPLLAAQNRLPLRLRMGIGWTYKHLPERLRLGSGFDGFRRLAAEVESWSPSAIETYQLAQLRIVLTHAAAHSPFYAQHFAEAGFDPSRFENLEDLEGCPTISKTDLLESLGDVVTDDPSALQRLYMTTGGSTGTPVGFYLQKGVSRPKEQAYLEAQWRRAGYFDGARLAVVRGTVTSDRAKGRISSYDPIRNWLFLSSYHLTEERLPEYLDEIARFRPDILHIYPSAALLLAAHLETMGLQFPVRLRSVFAASERMTDPQRRQLEATFGCRIYSWYGHAERVVLAGQGRHSNLFYFWPTYGYVEFGPPDADGLQEVIGTSFHNLVMPLIRYRTGDFVRVYDEQRDGPREFPWSAAQAIEGREQEFLVTATGRRISLTAFNMHDASFDGLYALQFFQETKGHAELRYVAGPNFDTSRLPRVMSVIRRKLGDDFEITLRQVDDIEKTRLGKGRWLVSTLGSAPDESAPATPE